MIRLLALLALTGATAAAQPVVSVRVGLDANAVPGLAAWQQADREALNALGVAVVPTDSFPSFASFQADVSIPFAPLSRAGVHVGYGSTSGRLDYSDYSGHARVDHRARRVFVGATGDRAVVEVGPASLWATLSGRVSRVTVDYHYELEVVVGEEGAEATAERYTATPVSIEPGLALEFAAGRHARLRIVGGREWSFGGEFAMPPDAGGSVADASWEGYRAGVSVGARF